jgi:hypothetical protein
MISFRNIREHIRVVLLHLFATSERAEDADSYRADPRANGRGRFPSLLHHIFCAGVAWRDSACCDLLNTWCLAIPVQ